MMSLRYLNACLAAAFVTSISLAAEPAATPKKFSAVIGGFFGPTYVVELRDGSLHYTEHKKHTGPGPKPTASATLTPTPEQWRAFRESIDQLNVWRWHRDYSDNAIADGTQWRLNIEYADHMLKTQGSNEYPKHLDRYLAAVQKLLGGRSFK
jgi:hypothetical protein